jgi:hypothetical protein
MAFELKERQGVVWGSAPFEEGVADQYLLSLGTRR